MNSLSFSAHPFSKCATSDVAYITALSLGPGQTQVTMFGGCLMYELEESLNALPKLAETTVLEFGEPNR